MTIENTILLHAAAFRPWEIIERCAKLELRIEKNERLLRDYPNDKNLIEAIPEMNNKLRRELKTLREML